jgi:DnaJ-class molecular chaperone
VANFNEIEEARKLLGLGEAAKLKEIKSAYRRMAHRHHPDKRGGSSSSESETMRRLNWAYKLLLDYCNDYKYSFKKEDIARAYPHEEYLGDFKDRWFDSI